MLCSAGNWKWDRSSDNNKYAAHCGAHVTSALSLLLSITAPQTKTQKSQAVFSHGFVSIFLFRVYCEAHSLANTFAPSIGNTAFRLSRMLSWHFSAAAVFCKQAALAGIAVQRVDSFGLDNMAAPYAEAHCELTTTAQSFSFLQLTEGKKKIR